MKSIILEYLFNNIRKSWWLNKRFEAIDELLNNLVAAPLIFIALACMLDYFIIDAWAWLSNFLIYYFFNLNLCISDIVRSTRKHDYGHSWCQVKSKLKFSELIVRSHSQADVTNQELNNHVNCCYDNID